MKRIVLAALGLVILAAGFTCVGQESLGPAPAFSLEDLSGNTLELSQYSGKVLVLNFWATWCPPCQAEIPDFVSAYNRLRSKGLAVIGLSLDRLSADELKAFVAENHMSYPVAFATEKIMTDYKPGQYIPATIVIDKKGMIRERHVGLMQGKDLEKLFSRLINEK
jgi:peroxiredoxin